MASFNRVILVGNLTRDPQLSYTPANTPLCKFGVATNRKWKDHDGNQREEVCYVDCTVFGRSAETFNQYMAKGRPVLLEGRLQYQQWTTPEGQKRSKHEVIVENFKFLGGGGRGAGDSDYAETSVEHAPLPSTGGGYGGEVPPPPHDDDIPF